MADVMVEKPGAPEQPSSVVDDLFQPHVSEDPGGGASDQTAEFTIESSSTAPPTEDPEEPASMDWLQVGDDQDPSPAAAQADPLIRKEPLAREETEEPEDQEEVPRIGSSRGQVNQIRTPQSDTFTTVTTESEEVATSPPDDPMDDDFLEDEDDDDFLVDTEDEGVRGGDVAPVPFGSGRQAQQIAMGLPAAPKSYLPTPLQPVRADARPQPSSSGDLASLRSAAQMFEDLPIVQKPRQTIRRGPSPFSAAVPHRPRVGSPLTISQPAEESDVYPQQSISPPSSSWRAQPPTPVPPPKGSYQPPSKALSGALGATRPAYSPVATPQMQPRSTHSPSSIPQSTVPVPPRSTSSYTPAAPSSAAQVVPPVPQLARQSTMPSTSMQPIISAPGLPVASLSELAPPPRAQTQSPGKREVRQMHSYEPAANAQMPGNAYTATSASDPGLAAQTAPTRPRRARGSSMEVNLRTPVDGRQHDPLQRWRGAPIACFGPSGAIVTMFTKNVPSFGGGAGTAQLVSTPLDLKVRSLRQILPLDDSLASFPGPLRSKSRKKEVIAWMEKRISALKSALEAQAGQRRDPVTLQREGERLVLWQLVSLLVIQDGSFDGKAEAQKMVNEVLVPPAQKGNSHIRSSSTSDTLFVPPQPEALAKIQHALQSGAREDAVWHAVDAKEWAHALIISSTIGQDIYKRVVQEFVRSNVRSLGKNARPLAALYQSFAGNAEESVDELVPAAARAGFQMMSTEVTNQPQANGLEGLESWRDTLGLILANRTPGDQQTLLSLGKLLQSYGRIEAAHCCFMFASPQATFGDGPDLESSFKLLGVPISDVHACAVRDLDSILLSEVYEFALSLAPGSTVSFAAPHLQAWKLLHAKTLMESGKQLAAQQYCEAIMNAVRASTKLSPYYHQNLLKSVDQLTERLSQSPSGDSASWISKPTMEKVSESMWSKFHTFVAGDDSDSGSRAPKDPSATFAHVPGESPDISRSSSRMDMYSAVNAHRPAPISTAYSPYVSASGSRPQSRGPQGRYAPSPKHDAQDPTFADAALLSRSYDSAEGLAPPAPGFPRSQSRASTSPTGSVGRLSTSGHHPSSHLSQVQSATEDMDTTAALPARTVLAQPMTNGPMPDLANGMDALAISTKSSSPGAPSPASRSNPSPRPASPGPGHPYQYNPWIGGAATEPREETPEESNGGYRPLSPGPGWQPATFDNDDDIQSPPPPESRRRMMEDDDDDFDYAAQAQKLKDEDKKKDKERIEREGRERMAKAAAADARRDSSASSAPRKGLFAGLGNLIPFGGGSKDPNEPVAIKAKLGEESSFYYDPEQKRWINKKAGAEQTAAPVAPPPPKSRGPSGGGIGSNSLPASRSASPAMPPMARAPVPAYSLSQEPPVAMTNGARDHGSGSTPPPRSESPAFPSAADGAGAGMPPPLPRPASRPRTATSEASSMEDLIGPPLPRKIGTGTVKKQKKGRGYIDLMAKKE